MLRAHGLSGAAAAAVWAAARKLVARTRRRGVEYADTLDAFDGEPVVLTIGSTIASTDLTPHLAKLRPDREYVQVHTHPASTSFSYRDLARLVDRRAIIVMVVVGLDGTWHVVSRAEAFSETHPSAIVESFLGELERLASEQVAVAERSHRATQRMAARYGLRYDRVRGSTYERPHP